MKNRQKLCIYCAFLALAVSVFSSCSSRLGWGVLLWASDDPFVPSGTVLPVYIRSNIDGVWVVGLPDGMRTSSGLDKMEVPIAHLELVGNRARADAHAQGFAPFALTYAENLQAGLPIRANPDNNARRVYRMREGDIIKVLGVSARGVPPLGVTGAPLPGQWYRVLTEDGTVGYTFSYRLRFFEHVGGTLAAPDFVAHESPSGSDLDLLMSRTWLPESYLTMVNSGVINLEELSRRWHFNPGRDTNVAHVVMPGINQLFPFTGIVPSGSRAWRFEGTPLSAQLRSDTVLSVQFTEAGGAVRNLTFVSLPVDIDDLIAGEIARRASLHGEIFRHGPVFTSSNFGTIVFGEDGAFSWRGFDLLVPQHIPRGAQGYGTVSMDLFLSPALENHYDGAFTMRFAGSDGREVASLRSMYTLDSQGFRIEIVPESSIDGVTVARRASSPMVLFFFADDGDTEIAGAEAAGTSDLL
ncbi:MAG: SH3 domain-containing protein [Treponema sp.]|nr:SH3 domain-containing protein [Treponema sp.]